MVGDFYRFLRVFVIYLISLRAALVRLVEEAYIF